MQGMPLKEAGLVGSWYSDGGQYMANDELNLAKGQEGEAKASGGMKKIILILVAVLLLGGIGAGAYFMLGSGAEPETGAAEAEPEEPETDPIYLAISPAFVVNFEQNGRTRFLQVEMQVMSHDQEIIDKVEANMPAVKNGIILLLGDQDYPSLNTTEGKENLRKQVQDSINTLIRAKETPRVDDVFFTGFVMQ